MKRFPHPRRECACESSRAGASQARYCKKVPEKGDENFATLMALSTFPMNHCKKVPEKGDENNALYYLYLL